MSKELSWCAIKIVLKEADEFDEELKGDAVGKNGKEWEGEGEVEDRKNYRGRSRH